MSEPLEAARRAVNRSDEFQGSRFALIEETRAIRDALRALIQLVSDLEQRIVMLEEDIDGHTGDE